MHSELEVRSAHLEFAYLLPRPMLAMNSTVAYSAKILCAFYCSNVHQNAMAKRSHGAQKMIPNPPRPAIADLFPSLKALLFAALLSRLPRASTGPDIVPPARYTGDSW